jgi:putative nucleotidyltransferase with HDIG domain
MGNSEHPSYEGLRKQLSSEALSSLLEVSSSLASTLDLVEILQIAISKAVDIFQVGTGAIYTLEDGSLMLGATTPPMPADFPDELRHVDLEDHPHIKQAISLKTPVYLADARTASLTPSERTAVEARGLVSILYFPLLLKGEAIGTFILGTSGNTYQFSEGEVDLGYILSYQASLAIANARLFGEAQQAIQELDRGYTATLEGWSHMLDMRDRITDEHTQRVANLAVDLASRAGVPESDLINVYRGALLHDIGKMGIPDQILRKPGALTESEWTIMKTHSEIAFQTLSQIDFLEDALDIPHYHHEKWDGTGYPYGLAGEEIPLMARIFAVVDVFDALLSDRPYRKAWDYDKTLAYLESQSGMYFDTKLVSIFLEMIQENDIAI